MEEAERLCDRVAIVDHGRIVDIGAPADLVLRHCPQRTVVVTTHDASAVARFGELTGVASVSADGPRITIRGTGGDMVSHVIGCVAEHRMRVDDFRTELPTLEDVFLGLTGHSIRH